MHAMAKLSYRRDRKKKRFAITISLTAKQMASLENYCRLHKTTPNRVIRERISPQTSNFANVAKEKFVSVKQLDMFSSLT